MYLDLVKQFPFMSTVNFDMNGFKKAIEAGCQDMTVRTMKRKDPNRSVTRNDLANYLSNSSNYPNGQTLLCLLEQYFKSSVKNEMEYDKWHKEACESVLACLKEYYMSESVTYGKAQKVVNIAMKHICCLKGAEGYYNKGYFKYCHMPLDSFILEWVYRKSKGMKIDNVGQLTRNNFIPWSNISENRQTNKDGKIILSYNDIQNVIRKIDCQGLTPFEAEFFVWHQMKQAIAAEALFDPALGGVSISDFKKEPLNQKMIILQNLCKNNTYPYYLI